jgi:radical SAM protein with 4Fe4S-binding SPASM domain
MKHFYVSLTEACNLDCAWCFWHQDAERAGDEFYLPAVLGTIERALSGVGCGGGSCAGEEIAGADVGQAPGAEITESFVVFYGGEPTLRMGRMVEVMDAVEGRFPKINWRFAVQTNGTRLADVESLAERIWYVSLSINEYTFEHIDREVLERLAQRMPIIARMTYAGKSLVELVEPLLPSVSHVYWQLMNAGELPFTVEQYGDELERLLGMARCHPDKMFVPLDYAWSCDRAFSEAGAAPPPAAVGDHDWFPCGVGGDLVYVDPRGQTSVCDELSLNGLDGDFGQVVGAVQERCASCELVAACRGRCPAVHMKFGVEAFDRYCELTRLLFERVRAADHRGRAVDEVGLQTEVMH